MVVLETEGVKAIAAAIAIFGGALGTGIAQSAIGASAVGVIAEKPDQASKLLIWLAIPESLVIFGFIVAAVLLFL